MSIAFSSSALRVLPRGLPALPNANRELALKKKKEGE
jgi:hypothetical protein